MIHLITGGVSSGKSRFAEDIALGFAGAVCYLATAEIQDAEFMRKVVLHRHRRPETWALHETDRQLAQVLTAKAADNQLLLVDCLSMWLMRFFSMDDVFDEAAFACERLALFEVLSATLPGEVILVTNEIGLGGVAASSVSRRFVMELGKLSQDIAALADEVTLVVCGLPLVLKHKKRLA